MAKFNFSEPTLNLLARSGWTEDRRNLTGIKLPEDFNFPDHVLEILDVFGGLSVGEGGKGVNVVKTRIIFEPNDAAHENEEDGIFNFYSSLINKKLYPLGTAFNKYLYVAIDEDGKLYTLGDQLFLNGNTFEEGIHNLLNGIKGKEFDETTSEWT